MGSTISGHGYN